MLITLIGQTAVTIFRTGKSNIGAASTIWMDTNGNVDVAKHIIHRLPHGGWEVEIHGGKGSPLLTIPTNVDVALDTPVQQLLGLLSGGAQKYARSSQVYGEKPAEERGYEERVFDPQTDFDTAYKPGGFGMPAGMMGGAVPGVITPGGYNPQAVPGGCGVYPWHHHNVPFANMLDQSQYPGMMGNQGMVSPNILPGLPIHCNFVGMTTEESTMPVVLTTFQLAMSGMIPAWARVDWIKQNRCISQDEQDLLDLFCKCL